MKTSQIILATYLLAFGISVTADAQDVSFFEQEDTHHYLMVKTLLVGKFPMGITGIGMS